MSSKRYSKDFYLLNLIQVLELMAYWCILVQMPVYIAQKDNPGGLMWDQTAKGVIFFWWALMQNFVPVFTGSATDRLGHKRTLYISFVVAVIAIILLGTQRDFTSFLISALLFGFGLGIFKPALLGAISVELHDSERTIAGWGIYFMLMNFALLFGSPLSYFLKSISWEAVFFGAAIIFSINFPVLYFFSGRKPNPEKANGKPDFSFKSIIYEFKRTEVFGTVILMSGFFMVYMQFYETLPNFLTDWTDTSGIAAYLGMPSFMLSDTGKGIMISYEWLYMLNSILIICFVIHVGKLFSKMPAARVMTLGAGIASIGLFIAGIGIAGIFAVAGIVIYTFGEMTANPKYYDFMSKNAKINNKAVFMSFMNISLGTGFAAGSLFGSYIYKIWGEKAGMALVFIQKHFPEQADNVTLSIAFNRLEELTGLNGKAVTELLWNEFNPWLVWLPIAGMGLLSALGLLLLDRRLNGKAP